MKKWKIIVPIIALVLFIATVTTILIVTNKKESTDVVIEPKTTYALEKPKELVLEGNTLSWGATQNVQSYIVYIDDLSYVVNTNSIDLDGIAKEGSVICVKAKGANQYYDSSISIKLVYHVDEENPDIQNIQKILEDFIYNIFIVETNQAELAKKMYLAGLSSNDLLKITEYVNSLIDTNLALYDRLNKYDTIKQMFEAFINILNIDSIEYNISYGLINTLNLYFSYRIDNPKEVQAKDTTYYNNQVSENYESLCCLIDNLSQFDYQSLASNLHYLDLYIEQIKSIFGAFTKMEYSKIDLISDINTIKDTLCNVLINELPTIDEYNTFKDLLVEMYEISADSYLSEKCTKEEIDELLKFVYDKNNFILNFLKKFNESDIRLISSYIENIRESFNTERLNRLFSSETIEGIISTLKDILVYLADFNNLLDKDTLLMLDNALSEEKEIEAILEVFEYKDYINLDGINPTYLFDNFTTSVNSIISEILELNNIEHSESENLLETLFNSITTGNIDFNSSLKDLIMDYINSIDLSNYFSENLKFDIDGFINNAINMLGIKEVPTDLKENINKLIEYGNDYYTLFIQISQILTLLSDLRENPDAEISSIDIEKIMGDQELMETAGSIDFISIYNLYKLIYNKYIKFDLTYKPLYDYDFDLKDIIEVAPSFVFYIILGVDAPLLENLTNDFMYSFNHIDDYIEFIHIYKENIAIIEELAEKINLNDESIISLFINSEFENYILLYKDLYVALYNIWSSLVELKIVENNQDLFTDLIKLSEYYLYTDLSSLENLSENIIEFYKELNEFMSSTLNEKILNIFDYSMDLCDDFSELTQPYLLILVVIASTLMNDKINEEDIYNLLLFLKNNMQFIKLSFDKDLYEKTLSNYYTLMEELGIEKSNIEPIIEQMESFVLFILDKIENGDIEKISSVESSVYNINKTFTELEDLINNFDFKAETLQKVSTYIKTTFNNFYDLFKVLVLEKYQ